ncbi:TonB-dependent receptor [uncultured Porphyromonas sp.]|uniref:TonB-dependent receptor n=1 Tax=uncultured Porphyromonas sp. TaxID=159274 RepID=UPI00260B4DB5|nr:TonB-dependent receptor [uncultured Porphyromonas sp.]
MRQIPLRSLCLLLILHALVITLPAQVVTTVRGAVRDSAEAPLVGANVAFYRLTPSGDKQLVAGGMSDGKGRFTIAQVPQEQLSLEVSYIGYQNYQKSLTITAGIDLGIIQLEEDAHLLEVVVVEGKATDMTVRGDTIAFNADAYKVPQGAMLEELVKRLPGAEIDENGQITIGGQQVAKIMLDGKEFFSGDTKVAMRNLPASVVNQLEVLNQQSDEARVTSFDDDEEQTVLNIRTKPDMRQGTFGHALAGYGLDHRYELSGMLNYFSKQHQTTLIAGSNNTNGQGLSDLDLGGGSRGWGRGGGRRGGGFRPQGITTSAQVAANETYTPNDRLEINANARYGYSQNDLSARTETENLLPDSPSTFTNETTEALRRGHNLGGDAFIKWQATDRTELIYRPAVYYGWGMDQEERNYRTTDSEDNELHRGSQENLREHSGLRLFNMLLLGHKLNDEGRTLSLQLNGGFLGDNSSTESHSMLHSVEGDQSQQTLLEDRNQTFNYRIRTGYVEPLTELLSLQAQLEWSDRIRSSERDYKTPDATGAWTELDATMDTKMNTRLSSLSGGVDLKVANKLIDLTVGLRVRPTWMTTEQSQLTSQEPLVRRETIWAPSLNFRYTPSKQTMLRLGYWGRSEMPSAGQMYTLPDATNLRESIVGNPDLRPSYQHQMFGMFRTFIPSTSQAINLRFFGAYTHHAVISDQTVDAKTQRRQITYINADGGEYMVHGNGSFTTPLFTKSLSLAVTLGSAYNYRLGRINGVTNGAHSWTFSPNLSLAYSNSWLYLRAKGGLRYHYGSQSLQIATSPHTYDWSAGGDASVTLPLGFKVESEAIYTQGVGYQEPYNVASVLWSAGLSYSFLKDQAATLRIKVYDLLNEQQSISRQVTATEISDTWSNSLGRYAMLHFIYRFRL